MPSALYNIYDSTYYNSKEEMLEARRKRTNKYAKIRYYKKTFGVNVKDDEYDLFTTNFHRIKKVLPIKDFLRNHFPNKIYKEELDIALYSKNYQHIKNIEDLLPFINNLDTIV